MEYFRFGLWWLALGVASSIGLGMKIILKTKLIDFPLLTSMPDFVFHG